jgi:uncharacterized membrane protein YidH (DUF202 family)
MRREEKSMAEDIIKIASYMPWWTCLILALISFLIFSSISNMPSIEATAGNAGNYLGQTALKIFGTFARIIVPGILVIAAIVSWIEQKKGRKEDPTKKMIAYVAMGLLAVGLFLMMLLFSRIGKNAGELLDNLGSSAVKKTHKKEEIAQKPIMKGKDWSEYGYSKPPTIYKTIQSDKITYTNDPKGERLPGSAQVEVKKRIVEFKPKKQIIEYRIYYKNGQIVRSKFVEINGHTAKFVDSRTYVEMPLENIKEIKEEYLINGEKKIRIL